MGLTMSTDHASTTAFETSAAPRDVVRRVGEVIVTFPAERVMDTLPAVDLAKPSRSAA